VGSQIFPALPELDHVDAIVVFHILEDIMAQTAFFFSR
jgi:hypothetical protein